MTTTASVGQWEYDLMRAPRPESSKTFGAFILTGVMALAFAVAVVLTQPGCTPASLTLANSALSVSAQVENAADGVLSLSCTEKKRSENEQLDGYCGELSDAKEAYSAARGALSAIVSIAEATDGPINASEVEDAIGNLNRASTRMYEAMSKISGLKQ